ncbi:MAG: serine/threonine protein kinase [Acidobacteria bacterium]|nr:MAG: serine/threonine protein kinase [Acidobacteriota bacterium]
MSAAGDSDWREIRRWVGELAETSGEERERRLAEVPEGLRGEVRSLLEAGDGELSMRLEAAVGEQAAEWLADRDRESAASRSTDPGPSLAGVVLGVWRLERPLGRGGMAEVWEAVRADGTYEQRVAVKLIKRGMDSEEIVARFRRERQILARLEHPAIARILDGGVAPDGRPWLALEMVDGEPITDWCRRHRADLAQRMALVVEVCDAVAAAHRQLVVHRDLKPSNILVDSEGRVRLLDFGIAKLLAGDGADSDGDATRTEARVLTPGYAAPEQIRGEPVSTATDVYALGVVAHELLTGQKPHRRRDRSGDGSASSAAVERPSVVLARSAAESDEPGRPEQARHEARIVAGDLDAVVLTALRAEPERRYPSVSALAADLEAWLDGRPVSARPDTAAYRIGKFVGRHRFGVAASLLALLLLLSATAFALLQSREARLQARRAERVRDFLTSIFEVSDPIRARGEVVTARSLLDEGLRRSEDELATEPRLRAEIATLLAGLYRKLGEADVAATTAERAWAERTALEGPESVAAAESELVLGWALASLGRYEPARVHLEHAISVFERVEGPDSLAAAEAREPLVELVFTAEGPAQALPIVERRLATYRAHFAQPDPRLGLSLSDLGVVLQTLERFDEAETALEESLEILLATLPADDPRLAYPYSNLAATYLGTQRLAEALECADEAVAIRRATLGPRHPETGLSRAQRLQALRQLGRLEEAEAEARSALSDMQRGDPFVSSQMRVALGHVLLDADRPAEALPVLDAAIAEQLELLPADHQLVLSSRLYRIEALVELGRTEVAGLDLDELIAEAEQVDGMNALVDRARRLRDRLD